ncbi:hypothetical protein FA95DRAFT_1568162 [Auriscalpium vulgare]|uniref:Uncharacterized protein n=1 Tax=Auriscalpium vulgare TaxID=40419 RepID=A0ACB8QZY4_9AGAM|nr:hypothetical protein FA95DRAFT_1568162 [Auriscalpium vulgare]
MRSRHGFVGAVVFKFSTTSRTRSAPSTISETGPHLITSTLRYRLQHGVTHVRTCSRTAIVPAPLEAAPASDLAVRVSTP